MSYKSLKIHWVKYSKWLSQYKERAHELLKNQNLSPRPGIVAIYRLDYKSHIHHLKQSHVSRWCKLSTISYSIPFLPLFDVVFISCGPKYGIHPIIHLQPLQALLGWFFLFLCLFFLAFFSFFSFVTFTSFLCAFFSFIVFLYFLFFHSFFSLFPFWKDLVWFW